jgi:hypothetical protein
MKFMLLLKARAATLCFLLWLKPSGKRISYQCHMFRIFLSFRLHNNKGFNVIQANKTELICLSQALKFTLLMIRSRSEGERGWRCIERPLKLQLID